MAYGRSAGQIMMIIFFDSHKLFYQHEAPRGQTVMPPVPNGRKGTSTNEILLHHDYTTS